MVGRNIKTKGISAEMKWVSIHPCSNPRPLIKSQLLYQLS